MGYIPQSKTTFWMHTTLRHPNRLYHHELMTQGPATHLPFSCPVGVEMSMSPTGHPQPVLQQMSRVPRLPSPHPPVTLGLRGSQSGVFLGAGSG